MESIKPQNSLVIFGVENHKAWIAEKLAREYGCKIAFATYNGNLVSRRTVKKANGFDLDSQCEPQNINHVILFEVPTTVLCSSSIQAQIITCKYPRANVRFGKDTDDFWAKSALGSFCNTLGIKASKELLLSVALSSYYRPEAYQNKCDGVQAAEVLQERIRQMANNALPEDATDKEYAQICNRIKKQINEEIKRLNSLPDVVPGIKDIRKDIRDNGYYFALYEVSLFLGLSYIIDLPEIINGKKTGRTKLVLGGYATAQKINQFIEWANSEFGKRISDVLSLPSKGYARAILK